MKLSILSALSIVLLTSCGRPSGEDQTTTSEADSTDVNRVLYDQVMDIHDEVMPRMEDIEALKRKLKDQIAASPTLVEEERRKLERRIANLDSVGQLMWDWMHEFSPLPDSLGQEAAREYYESELERIKQVREAMLGILEEEKGRKN
jgi:regulator of replication initiation timing